MLYDKEVPKEAGSVGTPTAIAAELAAGGSAGARVAAIRSERSLSVMDLALVAGMLPDHLRAIEEGLVPTVAERQALATALGVDPEAIGH